MADPALGPLLAAMASVYRDLKAEEERMTFAELLHGKIYADFRAGLSQENSLARLKKHVEDCHQEIQLERGVLIDPFDTLAEPAPEDSPKTIGDCEQAESAREKKVPLTPAEGEEDAAAAAENSQRVNDTGQEQ